MKRLWSGEEVTFSGTYTRLTNARLGFTPYQKPHPPIEMGAQSEGATKRAARLADSVFFGPQVAWADIKKLAEVYRNERREMGQDPVLGLGTSRSLIVGKNKEDATRNAHQYVEKTFNMYRSWEMQEKEMVPLQLGFDRSLDDWALVGSPKDCVERLLEIRESTGLDRVGFTIYSLPREPQARIEFLQMIAEEIVRKVA
jgi:alkanesulfonate monooxygenase SsuD/methylene tetrahydromethanopterin reductase-like flavin-dependent oxidoreductase (luciferase family)